MNDGDRARLCCDDLSVVVFAMGRRAARFPLSFSRRRLNQAAIISAGEVALLVAGLQYLAVVYNDAQSSRKTDGPQKRKNSSRNQFRALHPAAKLRKVRRSGDVLHVSPPWFISGIRTRIMREWDILSQRKTLLKVTSVSWNIS
ncbi:MAG: hypothetical protein P4M01_13080 [Acidobacteriota bacterium]|nr:hypothetical protein [Acidobacteriota bacterium]